MPELPLLPLILDDVPPALTQAIAQVGIPFRHRALEGSEGRIVLFDSRRGLSQPPGYGQVAIDIDLLREPAEADPFEALADERVQPHRWEISGRSIREDIGEVDRYALRRRLLDRLRQEIENAGGIWVCVSAFPFPYHSAFNFRIDHPQLDGPDFAATLQTIAGHAQAVSHFVDGAAFESNGHALTRLRDFEVGSLVYPDDAFLAPEDNLEHVRRGVDVLRAVGFEASGFAMSSASIPRSRLNTLERMELAYGAQSALAYDDMPFCSAGSHLLQIPMHPVSLAGFLRSVEGEGKAQRPAIQQALRAAVDHFRQTARSKYHAGEPVFFFGQSAGSLGRYPQVLESVFDTVDSFGAIWNTTLGEFADWWRARAAVRLTVSEEDGHYVVASDCHSDQYHVGIEYWRGRHVARMQLQRHTLHFSPTALAYESCAGQSRVQAVRIDPPEGLRGRLRRWMGGISWATSPVGHAVSEAFGGKP